MDDRELRGDDPELGLGDEPSLDSEIERLRRPTSWAGAHLADFAIAYLHPRRPFERRQARLFSLAVIAAVLVVFWLTRWPLGDWPNADVARYFIHPILWSGVALLAGFGWRRLEDRPLFSPMLTAIALGAGLLHVTVLVVAGAVASFTESPVIDGAFDYVLNALHVITFLAGLEFARAYLFNAWKGRNRAAAFTWVTLLFAVVALSAAELTPFDTLDEFFDVAGGRWIPVLVVSLLATALAGIGGPGPPLAYRVALTGLVWLSPRIPDLHWIPALVIGVLVPWIMWRVVTFLYRLTAEGEKRLEDEPEPSMGIVTALFGLIVMVAVIVTGLFLVFGTGVVGFRTQIIVDDAMEPAYERGDVVLVQDDPGLPSLDVGDVVRLRRDGETLVRRIVAVRESLDGFVFTLQADNRTRRERGVTEDDLAGEVILRIPNAGDVILWWRD